MSENKEITTKELTNSIARKVVGSNNSSISADYVATKINESVYDKETLEWLNKLIPNNSKPTKK